MSVKLTINADSANGDNGEIGKTGDVGAAGTDGKDSNPKGKCCSSSCVPATNGSNGGSGATGGHGSAGTVGADSGMITVKAITYASDLSVHINLIGGNGGNGGAGGTGGAGGVGGAGGKTKGDSCKDVDPANGGNGGDGGNGGTGGNGGSGGAGGIALFQYQSGNDSPLKASANVLGGSGGAPGASGKPGAGGAGGAGGANDTGGQVGTNGTKGSNGLPGGSGSSGELGKNGQQSISPEDLSNYQDLVETYSVPADKQYEDLDGATVLDATATSGIVPFITTASGNMDTMRTMVGSANVKNVHLYSHDQLQTVTNKSAKDLSAQDFKALRHATGSYLLGDTDKVAAVKPLLESTIATTDIAIFAVKSVVVPAGGLSITSAEGGPQVVLLLTEDLSFPANANVNVDAALTLTINADQLSGSTNG